MADRTIRTVLTLDPSQYESGMQRAQRATKGLGDQSKQTGDQTSSAMQRMAQSARDNRTEWQQVGGALATVGGITTGLMGVVAATGIGYNNLRQTATQGLTAVTGSTEEAVEQMRRLDEYGQNSWLMRDSLVRAQQRMTGFGIETEKVIPYMDALAEGVAAAGGSSQDFEELAQIMGRVNSQGKLTAETFNEFGNRGIDAAQMIGDAMGMTAGQIRDSVTAGTLDAGEALDALAEGLIMNFEGSSDLVRSTFRGAADDVMAAFRDISAIAMSPLVDPEGGGLLTSLLNQASDLLFALRDLPDPILQVGGALTGLGGLATLAAGGFLVLAPRLVETWDALSKMGRFGEVAQTALLGLRGRLGSIVSVAGAAAAALALVSMGASRVSTEVAQSSNEITASLRQMAEGADVFESMFEGIADPGPRGEGFARDFQSFVAEGLGDDSMWARIQDGIRNTGNALGALVGLDLRTPFDKQLDTFEEYDRQLAALSTQSVPDAAASFAAMADAAGATDQAALLMLENMPEFRNELVGLADSAGLATDDATLLKIALGLIVPETEAAAGAAGDYEGALASLAESQAEARDRLDEWIDSMGQAAASFGGVIDGYNAAAEAADSSTASMEDWISEMQSQAEAVANWRENTLTASAQIRDDLPADMQEAGQAMVNELALAGDEGAAALQTFVDGTPEQRRQLIEAWQGTGYDVGVGFANELTSAPDGEIGANTFPAEQALAALLGAVANSEEHVIVNGNPVPAGDVLSAVRHAILTTEEPVTIDGNDVPASDVLNALMTAIRNEEEDVTINGNRVPADQVVTELMGWVSRQHSEVSVGADTSAAMSRLGALDRALNSINGRQVTASVAIQQYGQAAIASGGYVSDFATALGYAQGGAPKRFPGGGSVFGPGTRTSDSIPAWLSRGEFVQQAAAVQHYGVDTMYALNRRQIPKEALHQFTGGGSPQHVTQYLPAPRSTATPQRVSLDGVRIRGRLDLGDGLSGVIDGRIEERERQNRTFGGRS